MAVSFIVLSGSPYQQLQQLLEASDPSNESPKSKDLSIERNQVLAHCNLERTKYDIQDNLQNYENAEQVASFFLVAIAAISIIAVTFFSVSPFATVLLSLMTLGWFKLTYETYQVVKVHKTFLEVCKTLQTKLEEIHPNLQDSNLPFSTQAARTKPNPSNLQNRGQVHTLFSLRANRTSETTENRFNLSLLKRNNCAKKLWDAKESLKYHLFLPRLIKEAYITEGYDMKPMDGHILGGKKPNTALSHI